MAELRPASPGATLALPLLAALAALALRVALLGQHAFHMDEALYATFSRRILHGDLLLTGGLNNDKPPLQFYLGALGLALGGNGESAIRFMDALASAAECGVLVWGLAPFSGGLAALGAGLLLASSPLHRAYGASGVMDGPLALGLTLSFVLGLRGRPLGAGLAWGLACASKQTALFLGPLALGAALLAAGAWLDALALWAVGAAAVLLPLTAWSLLFSHPRLGMIVGMAAHQPEVGLRLGGAGARFVRWLAESDGLLPYRGWAVAFTWIATGAAAGLGWVWRRRPGRAWALFLAVPLWSLGLFALLNMRHFDRYFLPLAAPLAALPALLIAPLPAGLRRWAGLLVLGLGLLGLARARVQTLPLTQQGAAGATGDGLKTLLLEAAQRLPKGGSAASSQGGLRWIGNWYLPQGWEFADEDGPADLRAQAAAHPDKPLVWIGRGGQAPPAGWAWRALAQAPDGLGGAPWCAWVAEGPR